jgi:hypothetical protein
MLLTASFDSQNRFGNEILWRLSIALSRLQPELLAREVFNLIANAADLGSYFDVALGGDGNLWLVTLVPYAVAFVYCGSALWRALRGRTHDVVAAVCGALQIFYVCFVWLSYNQIAANYSPITYVFAAAMGCTVVAGARWIGEYTGAPRTWLAITLVVAAVPLLVNTHRRDQRDMPLSINLHAERALGSYLRSAPGGGPVVVTTNPLVGVPEAFTGVPAVRLDLALGGCPGSPAEADDCRRRVLVETIRTLPEARFVVPMATGVVDKSWEQRIVPALAEAAGTLQAQMEEEARFTTRKGEAVLALIRVAGPVQKKGSISAGR